MFFDQENTYEFARALILSNKHLPAFIAGFENAEKRSILKTNKNDEIWCVKVIVDVEKSLDPSVELIKITDFLMRIPKVLVRSYFRCTKPDLKTCEVVLEIRGKGLKGIPDEIEKLAQDIIRMQAGANTVLTT